MKMFRHKELIFLFALLAAAGCRVNVPSQAPVAAPIEHRAYHGPENQYYYFTAAQAQRNKGNLDRAVLLLRQAIKLDPESLYLQRELATVYIQNKEDDKALEVLEGLLQKNPNDIAFGIYIFKTQRLYISLKILCIKRFLSLILSSSEIMVSVLLIPSMSSILKIMFLA